MDDPLRRMLQLRNTGAKNVPKGLHAGLVVRN